MTVGDSATPRQWPRGVVLYTAATAVVAVLGTSASWLFDGDAMNGVWLSILLGLGLLSVLLREKDVGARVSFSFLSIVVISSTVLLGPVGSAIVGGIPMAFERGHRPAMVRIFNSGMFAIQGVTGGLVYRLAQGTRVEELMRTRGAGDLLLHVGLPLMAADLAQMLVNALLLSVVVRLSAGVPPRRFLVQIISNSGVAYLGYGFIGFLFVVLWVPADVGPFSAVLILAPLMVARWAFVQFGEEQRAHERALNALVTAVETKDPSAAGHSVRIATLAEWMAEPLGMGAQDTQALRFAALLHDVGKIGVPTRVLRGRQPTHADLELMTRHPEHGVELVGQIEFLAQSLSGIRHHHERWDGSGYPDGLARDDIPLASRVIAVADAFDALTTHRAERPAYTNAEALAELERRSGHAFDPAVVGALLVALDRHAWAPEPPADGDPRSLRRYVDHDDPVAWERVWSRPDGAGDGLDVESRDERQDERQDETRDPVRATPLVGTAAEGST